MLLVKKQPVYRATSNDGHLATFSDHYPPSYPQEMWKTLLVEFCSWCYKIVHFGGLFNKS